MHEDDFGPDVAARYDDDSAAMFAPEALAPVLDRLEGLAAGGPALELAIGTGRVGLPLAARGVPVTGIELSAAMVEQLRAKPGGAELPVTIGDMATTKVAGTFSLVYLVFNTVVNLTSQDAQVDCFVNAASHLRPGGCFVIEVDVPQLRRLPPGDRANVANAGPELWTVHVFDVVEQRIVAHHFTDAGRRAPPHDPVPLRVAGRARPDGPDRGVAAAGPVGRLARRPVHGESRSHVSVWEKPA